MNTIKTIQSRLNRKWTYTVRDTRGIIGLNERLFKQARGARILVYHGICSSNPTRFNSLFLTARTFEQHLQFYKKYFHIVSLDEYYEQQFRGNKFNVCLTFDDGFANNYEYVLPLLNKYEVPATFFVTGIRNAGYDILWNDFLAIAQEFGPPEFECQREIFVRNNQMAYVSMVEGRPLKELLREEGFKKKAELIQILQCFLSPDIMEKVKVYWMQMTSSQIKELSGSPFATIGCHGYYHNDLARIPVRDMQEELIQSRRFLENLIQKPVDTLAFPYGSYSRETITVSKSLGFTKLLAAEFLFPEDSSDPTLRERFIVNPYISVNNQMLATIHGKYC